MGGDSFSCFYFQNLGSHFYTQMTKTWVTFFFGPPHYGGGTLLPKFWCPPPQWGGPNRYLGGSKVGKMAPPPWGGNVPPHGGGFHFRYFFEGFGPLHHGGGTSEIPKSVEQKSGGPAALHHVKCVKTGRACGASLHQMCNNRAGLRRFTTSNM